MNILLARGSSTSCAVTRPRAIALAGAAMLALWGSGAAAADSPVAPLPLRFAQAAPAQRAAEPTSRDIQAREWADAQAALQASAAASTLASALVTLLGARSDADIEALAKFEKATQRLPWKSALALGVGNGFIYYGWASLEPTDINARGNADQDCRRNSGSPCALVMSNGKFDAQAFSTFSKWLGTRAQASVRQDLLEKMRTNPYQGGVGSILRSP